LTECHGATPVGGTWLRTGVHSSWSLFDRLRALASLFEANQRAVRGSVDKRESVHLNNGWTSVSHLRYATSSARCGLDLRRNSRVRGGVSAAKGKKRATSDAIGDELAPMVPTSSLPFATISAELHRTTISSA